ncbi:MarR family transcriptional regulator [Streptococcus chenjunshii]|uniref:MarR family transcriptional regulator n=2 Tax=Streptococcus chenjunshii TaxID=2173853 RepID=A0A372KN94_9STRE|nr:MarR family transcriptional regulator [Streptococcus chenjunshii]RFU51631.1 MarR family transcriptional regulator [Streptococcus chenjunshii]RFU53749.1 MarR family transcriptional regulator [Streptococcus chenjunshii]
MPAYSKAQQYARLRDEQFSLFEDYARKHGMNSKSLLVFMWIYHNQEGLSQERIAKKTFSSKQVVQAIVKNYVKKGWLYLEPSKVDKRKKLVRLTEKGLSNTAQLLDPLEYYEAKAMENLSAKEQEELLRTTQVFSQHLKTLLEAHQVIKND